MKIKILLVTLCLLCGLQTYAQQLEQDCQSSKLCLSESKDCMPSIATSTQLTVSPQIHKATPRKEIRHQIAVDGSQVEALNPMQRASGEYITKEFSTMGEIKGVVVLAAFADVPFSVSPDSINTLLSNRYNADNYTEEVSFDEYSEAYGKRIRLEATIPGSARDYFRAQSFGQFTPLFDVIGPVTLSQNRSYYGGNNNSGNDKNTSAMIREACQKAYDQGLTDFTDYDNDGDGVVDVVYVVYAGVDEAQTDISEAIWAKASTISLTLGDMKFGRYACSGELVMDIPVIAGIGTFIHEFSHILGLPDFYNTEAEDFTVDMWSVMDYGMYNAEGFVPCAYTAFERYSLDWIPMHTLDAPATMSIGTTDEEVKGYRIFTSEADTASFYMLENIRREGWNRYAPANGLLISEVTYLKSAWTGNKVNTGTHRHCIVPANNDYNYRTANKHLFGTENHEFSLTSTPSSRTQFGVVMDKPLTDINYNEQTGKTSFHFCGGSITDEVEDIGNQTSETKNLYDLLGRPVKQPTNGLYIRNGKKYLAF